jgi:hypothetical protein
MVYVAPRGTIYATVPGRGAQGANTVTIIDPQGGTLGASIPVGNEPGRIVASEDGKYLYVALAGNAGVSRVNLATQQVDLSFAQGTGVQDVAVLRGRPESVVVAAAGQATVYDNGKARPDKVTGVSALLTSTLTERLYGYNRNPGDIQFRRLVVTDSGIAEVDITPKMMTGHGGDFILSQHQGRLYSAGGGVWHAESRELLGTIGAPGWGDLVAADDRSSRVYTLRDGRIRAYDVNTLRLIAEIESPVNPGTGLIRFGEDGLALRGGTPMFKQPIDKIYLVRSALVAPPATKP